MPSRANEIQDAEGQQKDISTQKKQAQGQLNNLTTTADKIKDQMAELETKIAAAQLLSGQRQAAHAQIEKQVVSAQKELELKQKELEDRRVTLGKRAKGIYESGQGSYLELLFQSADLGDFITRMEYFSKLVSSDRQLLMDIQTQKEQITQKTLELQTQRDQAAQLKVQAASASSDLDKVKSEKRIALDKNKQEQQATFENIDRLESESNALGDKIRKLQAAQAAQAAKEAKEAKEKQATQPALKEGVSGYNWPVPGFYEISDPFGWRTHPITQKQSLHTGTDIVAPSGARITAMGDGVVILAGWNTAYGYLAIIDHGKGISTLYAHQSVLNVTEGQLVKANQLIGYVGSTGWSTGPHLHFEVRVGGNPTDPMQYFRN